MVEVDVNFAKSTNGILLLFTIVASAVCIGLLGDGTAVDIRRGYGVYLLIACCLSLVITIVLYALILLKKINVKLLLGGLFLGALLNITAFIVGGIYNNRFEKIHVVLTTQELASAALVILILIQLGFIHR